MFIEFKRDLEEINLLQQKFDKVIGNKRRPEDPILSYNPVLARWRAEKVDEGKEIPFREYELQQIKTMLCERYQVMAPPVLYNINSNGEIYHEKLPNESFLRILQRGRAYREQEGSQELQREDNEIGGWSQVFQTLSASSTVIGTKMIVISGPGLIENTAYPHNFVDVYEKVGFGSVKMVRFSSGLDYNSYSQKAKDQNPNYFENFNGPTDAWFLSHPLFIDPNNTKKSAEEVFKDMFGKSNDVLKQDEFEKIFEACMPVIQFYINVLCDKSYKPEELALAFNAVLNEADNQKKILKRRKVSGTEKIIYVDFEEVRQRVKYLGNLPVANIRAGCGLSGGFDLNSDKITNLLTNSVARFGLEEDSNNPLEFKCQKGHWNKRKPGAYKKYCDTCGCDVSCGIATAA